jgi:hypothetical protein
MKLKSLSHRLTVKQRIFMRRAMTCQLLADRLRALLLAFVDIDVYGGAEVLRCCGFQQGEASVCDTGQDIDVAMMQGRFDYCDVILG